MIFNSVIDAVGRTPLIRLSRLSGRAAAGQVLLKMEMLNPGGSHKARAATGMIEAYEQEGVLVPGSGQTILEASGGNTGVGIAMAAAVKGYRVHLVIPNNYSSKKQALLRLYGATIDLSDSLVPNSHGKRVLELLLEHPEWILLNQAANPANPEVHRRTTAQEIVADLDRLDYLVCGVGTGGHLTGVGSVLKTAYPDLQVVAVQPEGCDLLAERFVPHRLQGLAVGLLPPNLDASLIDDLTSVTFREAASAVRRLAIEEGIAAGLSSGANLHAALAIAQNSASDTVILTFAYDTAADYLDELGEE